MRLDTWAYIAIASSFSFGVHATLPDPTTESLAHQVPVPNVKRSWPSFHRKPVNRLPQDVPMGETLPEGALLPPRRSGSGRRRRRIHP